MMSKGMIEKGASPRDCEKEKASVSSCPISPAGTWVMVSLLEASRNSHQTHSREAAVVFWVALVVLTDKGQCVEATAVLPPALTETRPGATKDPVPI